MPHIFGRDLIWEAIRMKWKREWLKDDIFKHSKHFYRQPDKLKEKQMLTRLITVLDKWT